MSHKVNCVAREGALGYSLNGLYAITDARLQQPDQLTERVRQAIDGGARLIQYRDKSADAVFRLRQANALADLCRERGVALIINDDVELAAECGAQGVHLGENDADPQTARQLLGDNAIIGVSCYKHLPLALQAASQGADYIAFGRFFPSRTKPTAVQAGLDLIRMARQQLSLPLAAIGGITAHNAVPLVDAGVAMIAVVHGVFGAADVRQAAAAYAALFQQQAGVVKITSPPGEG
jgi:thiamine-phosphate pyrophosphorylase